MKSLMQRFGSHIYIYIYIVLVLSAINLFSLTIFSSSDVYADTNSSITISISGNINLDIVPQDTTGTFAKSSEQTIKVTSNHYSGYTLSIVGQDNTRQLKSTVSGSSNALESITSYVMSTSFSRAANTSYNSKWGFYPSMFDGSSNYYYRPGPTTDATIIDNRTSIPDISGTSVSYTFAIGARVSIDTPKEPYASKFIITAVGNAPKYTVNYISNTGSPSNMPSSQSGYISGRNIVLTSDIPQRVDDHDFLGWCTASTNDDSCSGEILQAGSTYYINDINYKENNIFNLYAVWEDPLLYMQDVLDWEDKIPNTGDSILVRDKRDGKKYWVGRQADGNIWMTQNLDFEITDDSLTSELTDLTIYGDDNGYGLDAGYSKLGDIIIWTPTSNSKTSNSVLPVSTETGAVSGTTGWTNDNYAPYSAEGGDVYVYTSNSTSNDTIYTSLSSCIAASHTEAECKHYHRGNYYNWSAAVASNNTNVTELITKYNTAQNSICPAGWRLPVGAKGNSFSRTNTEFAYLMMQSGIIRSYPTSYMTGDTTYATGGFNKLRSDQLFFTRSGSLNGSNLFDSGMYGHYWSSSVSAYNYGYYLLFYNTGIMPAGDYMRYYGFSVRCVARKTMQNISMWENDLNIGDEITVVDERDNKEYTVARQADGNIWMTQNLDFEITSAPLTSETSDLTTYDAGGYTSSAGYTKDGSIIKWTPASTAITSNISIPISSSTGTVSGVTNWTNDYYAPYSAEGGDVYVYTSNSTGNDTIYISLSSCIKASHTEAECKHYHRGNYYNWSAAVASNNTNVTELTTQYNTAQNSICPAGWRLPVGAKGSTFSPINTEFAYLLSQSNVFSGYPGSIGNSISYATNGLNDIRVSPLFFVRAGRASGTALGDSGIAGEYWSSSVMSSGGAFNLHFNSSNVYPNIETYFRYGGYSIRCVARRTLQSVSYWKDKIETGGQIAATDARDGKEYFVAKQADGNIWMTQNLDFEITSTPLSSETSDLTAYNIDGYANDAGYNKHGDTIKWTPSSTAVTSRNIAPTSIEDSEEITGLASWSDNNYIPYSAEGGDVYVYTSNSASTSYTNVDTIYASLSSCIAASHTEAECKHYHRGNYYNWSAAIAHNNTENVTEFSSGHTTARNSICPAGWRLPVGAAGNSFSQENTEFAYLLEQSNIFTNYPDYLGSNVSYATNGYINIRSYPMFFLQSGRIWNRKVDSYGTNGFYWSSSVAASNSSYALTFYRYSVSLANYHPRFNGHSVRCVAR